MLKQTLTMCAIFFCTQLVAQTWYPGRYVNDEGDTISGFIEIKETDRNPTSINYKTTAEAESITTLPMDKVKFFAYSFGEQYTRFDLSVSVDPNDPKFASRKLHRPEFKTVFLKRIAHGPAATLYSYTDEIKTRFYIFAPGYTKPLELGYGVVRDGQTLSENFEYRDMLTRTAETAGTLNKKLRGEIKRAQYKDFELIRLVNQINGVEAAATEEKSLKKSGHSFNAGVGVVFGKYVFYSDTDLGKKGVGSFNPGPSVTMGYDIAANPRVGKLFFRACLQYSIVEYTGKTYNDNFIDAEIHMKQQFTQSNFSYGLAAAYNFVNTDRLKFYISAGARAFNAKHDYKYTLTTVRSSGNTVANSQAGQPRKGWINAQLSAGVFLKKRLEISATYWPRVAMSPLTFQYTYGISMTEMAVRYHLIRQR